jgi:hypothetical protein
MTKRKRIYKTQHKQTKDRTTWTHKNDCHM